MAAGDAKECTCAAARRKAWNRKAIWGSYSHGTSGVGLGEKGNRTGTRNCRGDMMTRKASLFAKRNRQPTSDNRGEASLESQQQHVIVIFVVIVILIAVVNVAVVIVIVSVVVIVVIIVIVVLKLSGKKA